MDNVWPKSRSSGQILEKPCVRSRVKIFCLIVIKLGQNIFLDEISDEYENGSCQMKNKVKCSKNFVYALEATFSVR